MNHEYNNLVLSHTISNNEIFTGDIVTITDTITNSGLLDKSNLKYTATLPTYLQFVSGSVTIDGVLDANATLEIDIPSLPINETKTITYKVKGYGQYPNAVNYFKVSCEYQDIFNETKTFIKQSESLHTIILKRRLGILLNAEKNTVIVGETNHFHIDVKNYDKSQTITDVQIKTVYEDYYTISSGTTLLNETTVLSDDITTIDVGDIAPGEIITIDFDAVAKKSGIFVLEATAHYTCIVNENSTTNSDVALTLYSTIYDNNVNAEATLNIVYNNSPTLYLPNFTIKIQNKGTTEIVDANVTMDLSNYCTMVSSSLRVNGVQTTGDITTGITVDSIPVNSSAEITFIGSPNKTVSEKQIYAMINFGYMENGVKYSSRTYTNALAVSLFGIPDGDLPVSIMPLKESYYAGEKVNFQMDVLNNTDYKIKRLEIKPNIPDSVRYIQGSMQVDGTTVNYDDTIIIDEELNYGAGKTITFSAVSLKEDDASISAITTYTYDVCSTEQKSLSESYITNFQIIKNELVDSKTVLVSNVPHITKVGDVVTFTLEIKNDNDYLIPITDLLFKPILAANKTDKQYLSIDESTVTQDGTKLTKDSNNYFILSDINANETSTITFSVYAVNISKDELYNYVDILYSYVDDLGNTIETNAVDDYGLFITNKDVLDIVVTKETTDTEVYVGDDIHYSVSVTNNSNTNLKYFYVKDYMDQFVSFKKGSLYVDGSYYPNLSLEDGFDLTAVDAGETRTMEFDCEAISPGTYENVLSVAASTSKDDADTTLWQAVSNTAVTKINEQIKATYSVTLNCDNEVGTIDKKLDDIVTFNIEVTNQGNVVINNLQITEELDNHFTYITDSLLLDGHKLNRNLDYILIDTLDVNETRLISFEAKCSKGGENIEEQITTTSIYYDNENNAQTLTRNSNALIFNITDDSKLVTFNLTSDKKIVEADEKVEFKATISNQDEEDIDLENMVFEKILDNQYFDFDLNSVKQDGLTVTGDENYGYQLKTLSSGETTVVTFTATAIKAINLTTVEATIDYEYFKYGNTTYADKKSKWKMGIADVIDESISLDLTCDKKRKVIGDNIYFTLDITNNTEKTVNDAYIYEDFSGLTIVPATTKVNGLIVEDITNGITINEIKNAETVTVTFEANGKIEGTFPVTTYIVGALDNTYYGTSSNTIPITILKEKIGNIELIQSIDKENYIINEYATFNILVNNIGSEDISSLVITQTLMDNFEYVQDSLTIDGVISNNDINSIDIGTFDKDNLEISFKCKCIKTGTNIQSSLDATFEWQNNGNTETGNVQSNVIYTNIYIDDSVNAKLNLSVDTPIVVIHNMGKVTASILIENQSDYNIGLENNLLNVSLPKGNYQIDESSFLENGNALNGDLTNGYVLSDINANTTSVITFTLNPINNQYATDNLTVNLDYSYTNKNGVLQTENITKTTSIFYVDRLGDGIIDLELTAKPKRCILNDVIHYTLLINNVSYTTFTSFLINNIFADEVNYIPASVLIDGSSVTEEMTDTGGLVINKTVYSFGSVQVEFDVLATNVGDAVNTTFVKAIHAGGDLTTAYGLSVSETVNISNQANIDISFTKGIDYDDLRLGEIYKITLNITNNSNVKLTDLIVSDILDSHYGYVTDSLEINENKENYSLDSIQINSLGILETAIITFDILAKQIGNNISNKANMTYKYEANNVQYEDSKVSNEILSNIKDAINIQIGAVEESDRDAYLVQDTAIFTLNITNNSNIDLTDVSVTEHLDSNFFFINGSITIDNNEYNGTLTDIILGNLAEGETKIIKFQTTALDESTTDNYFTVSANYQTKDGTQNVTYDSNHLTIDILKMLIPGLKITKGADKTDYLLNEVATFTTVIENIGECDFIGGKFVSELNSSFEFVPNSVTVNGNSTTYSLENVVLGSLPSTTLNTIALDNSSDSITVSYQAKSVNYQDDISIQDVVTMDYEELGITKSFQALSNQVLVNNDNANFVIALSVDNPFRLDVQNTVKAIIRNTGEKVIENLYLITDFDDVHLEYVPNSIYVDGVLQNIDLESAINIPILTVNQSVTVTFDVIPIMLGQTNIQIEGIGSFKGRDSEDIPIAKKSNQLELEVLEKMNPNFTATLEVTKEIITLNELVNYTLTITNTGDVNFDKMLLTDILDNSIELVSDSVMVNGKQMSTIELDDLDLGTLLINQTTIVTFNAKPLIVLNDIANIAYVTAIYTASEQKQMEKTSNFAFVSVVPHDVAFISFSQEVSTSSVNVGDNIDFTLTFKNTGTKEIKNLKIYNNLNDCLEYVVNSIYFDNIIVPNESILDGYKLDNLSLGEEHQLRFSVKTIRSSQTFDNISQIACLSEGNELNFSSNVVQLSINQRFSVQVIKSTSSDSYTVGTNIPFLVKVSNNGDVDFDSVTITDNLISNVRFVPNSIQIDSAVLQGDIKDGITLHNLQQGEERTVHFETVALTAGTGLHNTANAHITYSGGEGVADIESNDVTFNIVDTPVPKLEINKTMGKTIFKIGEVIPITLEVINSGNVSLNQVILYDQYSPHVLEVPNSLKVDGVQTAGNIIEGILLGSMNAGTKKTVTFEVSGVSAQAGIINKANATYDYQIDSTKGEGMADSNTIIYEVATEDKINLLATKTSDKNSYQVGETATFTLGLTNLGSTYIKNTVVSDVLPANYEFIPNSVKVNGTPMAGDITKGVLIGEIHVNNSVTITFEAKAITVGNDISNTFNTLYTIGDTTKTETKDSDVLLTNITKAETPNIVFVKETDKTTYNQGETIHFTVTLTNNSNIPAGSLKLYDNLDKSMTFVPNSVKVDGVISTDSVETGVDVGSLPANFSRTVTFEALAVIPTFDVPNIAVVTYDYLIGTQEYSEQVYSNIVKFNILEFTCPTVTIKKQAITSETILGNTNTFLITVKNEGPTDIEKATLTDLLDDAYEYVESSLEIAGKAAQGDITKGIVIELPADKQEIIRFTALAKTVKKNISNKATVLYSCNSEIMLAESEPIFTNIVEDKKACLKVFKSFEKYSIKLGEIDTITLEVVNVGNDTAEKIGVQDLIPDAYEFIPGTLKLDDVIIDDDIFDAVLITNLAPQSEKKITFNVRGRKVQNEIKNIANYEYSYISSSGDTVTAKGSSNETTSYVTDGEMALLTVEKSQEHLNLLVGETTTVTLTVTNQGNVEVENINLRDVFAPNYAQDGNVVMVDGKAEEADMNEGVLLNPMQPNTKRVITFPMKALSSGKNIQNLGRVSYTYQEGKDVQIRYSNPVLSDVTEGAIADLEITKMALPSTVLVGEIVNYSFRIENVGKVKATNVSLSDILDTRLEIVPNSITINGEAAFLSSLNDIALSDIEPEEFILVEAQAKALAIGENITNAGVVTYKYQSNGKDYTVSKESNKVNVNIREGVTPKVSFTQEVSKTELKLNDVNTFTFIIHNNSNFELHDFTLEKYLPINYSLIKDSLKLIRTVGETEITFPLISPIISVIKPFEEVRITFDAYAILSGNNISNVATAKYLFTNLAGKQQLTGLVSTDYPTTILDVDSPNILFTKDISSVMQTGVESTVTINVENLGKVTASRLRIKEVLPDGLDFVVGSIVVDNVPLPQHSIIDGLAIYELTEGQKANISFKVIPKITNQKVTSKSILTYYYTDTSKQEIERKMEIDSEINIVSTLEPIVSLDLFTDMNEYFVNDYVNYRLIISLIGVTDMQDVSIKVPLLENYEFVENSLIVNGKNVDGDITKGVNVGSIMAPKDLVVLFRAKAIKIGNNLENIAEVTYTYQIGTQTPVTKTIMSNTVNHNILPKAHYVYTYKNSTLNGLIVGDNNTFTIGIVNNSTHEITNIRLSDVLDSSYRLGSIMINDIKTTQMLNDIFIDNLKPDNNLIITFDAEAIMPKRNILNYADVSYQYIDEEGAIVEIDTKTNTITTNIIKEPDQNMIDLIEGIALEEGNISDLLTVEAHKLESVIETGTISELLDINTTILEMVSLLLTKEQNSLNSLTTIVNNL